MHRRRTKRRARQPVLKTTQIAIRIMLSTLCRIGELTMARWMDVDLKVGEWFIPKAIVKGSLADMRIYSLSSRLISSSRCTSSLVTRAGARSS